MPLVLPLNVVDCTYTSTLERQKYLALLKDSSFDSKFKPSNIIVEDLRWWANAIATIKNPRRYFNHKLEIYTDPLKTDWGAVCHTKHATENFLLRA